MGKEEENLRLLFELIGGSRRSDRELAKVLGVSQPTVSRKREVLEKENFVLEYTIIPNLIKMGYEILAFTFLAFAEDRPELFEKAREWSKKRACVIYASDGQGLGMNSIMVSLHKNYASYSELITQLRRDWQPNLRDTQSFIISLPRHERNIKPFSFRYLKANN